MSSLLPFAISEINESGPESLYQIIQNELVTFSKEHPEVGELFVATEDGFEVATNNTDKALEYVHKLAAMTSSMIGLGEAMLNETGGGAQHALTLEGENKNIIFNQIRTAHLTLCLTTIASKDVPLGQLFWLQRQASGIIKKICSDALTLTETYGDENG
ncbi:hypothetical protein GJV11_05755 [Enterobacteriaceae bacterium RIT693]|jgi:hypothetical protein|nr:hypothetical protein [Enterobacteriaceae bacterium RIT693]